MAEQGKHHTKNNQERVDKMRKSRSKVIKKGNLKAKSIKKKPVKSKSKLCLVCDDEKQKTPKTWKWCPIDEEIPFLPSKSYYNKII